MRRTVAGLGRTLVTLGLLILLFVSYQLWGTGLYTERAQARLENQLQEQIDQYRATTTTAARSTTSTSATSTTDPGPTTPTTLAPIPAFAAGDPIAQILIPSIGVDHVVVQGTDRPDLQKGPGHYPATPFPGQLGNAAIAGHRTTYGAPFFRLDEVQKGDDITIRTFWGEFHYTVYDILIVAPDQVEVVAGTPDAQLTLTTCNPKYSARERLVVKARLVVEKSDPPMPASDVPIPAGLGSGLAGADTLEAGLAGDVDSQLPALEWGIGAAIVGLAWWWVFRRWRRLATWLAGLLPFLGVLFVFYMFLERMLPAGY